MVAYYESRDLLVFERLQHNLVIAALCYLSLSDRSDVACH